MVALKRIIIICNSIIARAWSLLFREVLQIILNCFQLGVSDCGKGEGNGLLFLERG